LSYIDQKQSVKSPLTTGGMTHLQPIDRPSTRFVGRIARSQSLDHQSFTPVLDTFVQELGDLVARVSIRALREAKLSLNELEVLLQKRPSVLQFLRQQRLRMGRTLNRATETASQLCLPTHFAIQVQQIESKNVHPDSDVFGPDVFPLASTQILEGEQFLGLQIVCHGLAVDYKRFDFWSHPL
jgi:hypothetical protein